MTEDVRGRCVTVEIDTFYQQVSRDDQITIGYLANDGRIVANSGNQSSRMLSRSCLVAESTNEIEFVHGVSWERTAIHETTLNKSCSRVV